MCREDSNICREDSNMCREDSNMCREVSNMCREDSNMCREVSNMCREDSNMCMNGLRVLYRLRIVLRRYGWKFSAPCPTCKLDGHPLSAVDDHLFSTLEASFRICRPSPLFAT